MKLKPSKRLFLFVLLTAGLFVFATVGVVYFKQNSIVQHVIADMNKNFKGSTEIKGSHISLFENFPYVSIDVEGVKIFENKEKNTRPILDVNDLYLGFDLWTVVSGKMEIKKIKLKNGTLDLVQHTDGELNLTRALSTNQEIGDPSEEFHLDLQKIELQNIDLTKFYESDSLLIETFISKARSKFSSSTENVFTSLDAQFLLNIVSKGDTTFIKHKHFDLKTEIDYLKEKELLVIKPTVVNLEDSKFNFEGSVDFLNDAFLDLKFNGYKPDFGLLIAMAPEELIPSLKKYDNRGKIFFEATVKGQSSNGNSPSVNARFGCQNAFFNNQTVNKKLDELNFTGYFTNGEKRDLTTMEFGIRNFTAKPEAGTFTGNLVVRNFLAPEIDLQINSDFELDFLAGFFNLDDLKDLKGKVNLSMNFKDIIDLDFPEKSLERLDDSYFMQLKIERLSFLSNPYHLPLNNLDLLAEVKGKKAEISYCNVGVGNSDISLDGFISDLPALVHHTDIPVNARLNVKSKLLDLFELTGSDSVKSIDERIENLSLNLGFKSSARNITESSNLPRGEFFIENLYAKLKNYPHTLHDFHADVIIEENDLSLIDFKGMIDKSDFDFSGKVKNYSLWFSDQPAGDTKIEFNLNSGLLQLKDVFTYNGENYVPEDYRHEELRNLRLQGHSALHFKKGLKSADFYLDKFSAKMKVHPLTLENFNGRVHYENEHLLVENFSGKMGRSDFQTSLNFYLGKDEKIKKRDNYFELTSSRLDFDELFNYHPGEATAVNEAVNHDSVFNIYELPFTDMTYVLKIDHLNYHRYLLNNINARLRSTTSHFIHIDAMKMELAGGAIDISGYFNGSDPKQIYFSPKMVVSNIDLDKILFKFDNFGQDYLVSENLHGKFSGTITGKIHMHTDLVPKIDDSEIHMDIDVINGRLENYSLLTCMSDYFKDKNLKKVLFDTLSNHIDITKGVMTIPKMTVQSSLGFMEISGKQDMDLNMEYFLKIPYKLVSQAASSKLFGKSSDEVDPDKEDAIQYFDPAKKTRFISLKLTGNSENYKLTLGKEKPNKKS